MNKKLIFKFETPKSEVIVRKRESSTRIPIAGELIRKSLDFIVCVDGNNLLYGAKFCRSPPYRTSQSKLHTGDSYVNIYYKKLNEEDRKKRTNSNIDYTDLISIEETNFLINHNPPNQQESSISNNIVEALEQKDVSKAFADIVIWHDYVLEHRLKHQQEPMPKAERAAIRAISSENKKALLKIAQLMRDSNTSINRASHARKQS